MLKKKVKPPIPRTTDEGEDRKARIMNKFKTEYEGKDDLD
jgi:hypothetical protein